MTRKSTAKQDMAMSAIEIRAIQPVLGSGACEQRSRITFRYPDKGVMCPILHETIPCTGTKRDHLHFFALARAYARCFLWAGGAESPSGGRRAAGPVPGKIWHRIKLTCQISELEP